ncbi:unnamed protein product [Acanthoscelides obtectus]|uniref:Uncharacterized protein n=1 Tax=Acanthoscelides obtectus TaxID=200917 RepID=A0A9P0NWS3_ACAOB|nr:unnamed protein product [Acanthoscelides obtectus]CAK1633947.1 hypothetical protein AOBTE_LOCUS8500 [Acanthoscelides obtectus]
MPDLTIGLLKKGRLLGFSAL